MKLSEPPTLLIIGGAAAALAYGFTRATLDVDTFNAPGDAVRTAAEQVRERTGMSIPIEHAGIAQAPYNFEDRLRPLEIDGVTHLHPRVPAPHDLIVMKLLRGAEHDIAAAAEIASNQGVTLDEVVESIAETYAVGDTSSLKWKYLAGIARMFGDEVAEASEQRIEEVLKEH